MNLEKNLRKEIQKKWKRGRRCWANPASLSAQRAARPASPSPSLPRARTRLVPASVGHVAAVRRRGARRGRPASPSRDAGPGSQATPFALSPAPLSFLPPLASTTEAVGAPPQCHRRSSSAAHRRPLQCPNLDAETTSALVVVAVNSCERSTEVRARRTP